MVDPWSPNGDDENDEARAARVRAQIKTLRGELTAYHPKLAEKPWIVAVNKCDLGRPVDPSLLPKVHYVSAQSRTGLKALVDGVWKVVMEARAAG